VLTPHQRLETATMLAGGKTRRWWWKDAKVALSIDLNDKPDSGDPGYGHQKATLSARRRECATAS